VVPDATEEPILPTRSSDDSDLGWGEEAGRGEDTAEADDDSRYVRDQPPHWEP